MVVPYSFRGTKRELFGHISSVQWSPTALPTSTRRPHISRVSHRWNYLMLTRGTSGYRCPNGRGRDRPERSSECEKLSFGTNELVILTRYASPIMPSWRCLLRVRNAGLDLQNPDPTSNCILHFGPSLAS